ncbi:MAG: epimerase [Acidobacteria bacterium]|nr:MAG: epimerase [Acidobacteriota bacterium]
MKTVLVTGGAGFIGSNFVRYLHHERPDYRVIVLDALTYAGNLDNLPPAVRESKQFEFWHGNVTNGEIVNTLVARSDVVVHFAAESHVARSIFDNRIFFETDVVGTHVVANAVLKAADKVERFIHISTSEVYGTALESPMTEEHPLNPTTPYAAAKTGADRLVYSYWQTYGIPAVIIRPFNQYGPHQHLEKVVPRFITSGLCGSPLTVHGDGASSRDWGFVGDTCEAIDKAIHVPLERVVGQAINLGTGRDVAVRDLATMLINRLGVSPSCIQRVSDRPGQVDRHIGSTQKAKALLDWEPTTSLEDGLDITIDWYSRNRDWWRTQQWMKLVPVRTREGCIEYH